MSETPMTPKRLEEIRDGRTPFYAERTAADNAVDDLLAHVDWLQDELARTREHRDGWHELATTREHRDQYPDAVLVTRTATYSQWTEAES